MLRESLNIIDLFFNQGVKSCIKHVLFHSETKTQTKILSSIIVYQKLNQTF